MNLDWSTNDNLEHYSVAVEFCEYIMKTITPQVISFCLKETYGIEGELWYEPLESQKLSQESKEFIRSLITLNGMHNTILQRISHRIKVMLSNSIDYNSYQIINNEVY